MNVHTTNYENAFIEVAEDCPAKKGETPPVKTQKSVANLQFEMLADSPYRFSSDDVLFTVHAIRNNIPQKEYTEARKQFFSKGQPCFRASPLTKRYGWGVHSDQHGKIAIYGCETPTYKQLSRDKSLKILKAMKSTR